MGVVTESTLELSCKRIDMVNELGETFAQIRDLVLVHERRQLNAVHLRLILELTCLRIIVTSHLRCDVFIWHEVVHWVRKN